MNENTTLQTTPKADVALTADQKAILDGLSFAREMTPKDDSDLAELAVMAKACALSGFFKDFDPVNLRRGASQALVKMLRGKEFGMEPMTSVENLYIIENRTVCSSHTMSGMIRKAGHSFTIKQHTENGCLIEFFRLQAPNRKKPTELELVSVGEASFYFEDAETAGLLGKKNWMKYPKDMYYNRTVARGFRMFYSDLLLGGAYLPDEVGVENNAQLIEKSKTDDPALAETNMKIAGLVADVQKKMITSVRDKIDPQELAAHDEATTAVLNEPDEVITKYKSGESVITMSEPVQELPRNTKSRSTEIAYEVGGTHRKDLEELKAEAKDHVFGRDRSRAEGTTEDELVVDPPLVDELLAEQPVFDENDSPIVGLDIDESIRLANNFPHYVLERWETLYAIAEPTGFPMPTFEELQAGSVAAFAALKENAARFGTTTASEDVMKDTDAERTEEEPPVATVSSNINHDSDFAKEVAALPPAPVKKAPKEKKPDAFTSVAVNESIKKYFGDKNGVANVDQVVNAIRLFVPDVPVDAGQNVVSLLDRKGRKKVIQRFDRCSSRLTPKNAEPVSPLAFFEYCAANGISLAEYAIMDQTISAFKKHLKTLNQ